MFLHPFMLTPTEIKLFLLIVIFNMVNGNVYLRKAFFDDVFEVGLTEVMQISLYLKTSSRWMEMTFENAIPQNMVTFESVFAHFFNKFDTLSELVMKLPKVKF